MEREVILHLIEEAYEAQKCAYAPYSHFMVGAALLTADDEIIRGCNIENSSYTPTNCAERTAFFKAVSEGITQFKAIAIVGNKEGEELDIENFTAPCGVCRQVMAEFCNPKTFRVILANRRDNYVEYSLEELLPLGFGPKDLI